MPLISIVEDNRTLPGPASYDNEVVLIPGLRFAEDTEGNVKELPPVTYSSFAEFVKDNPYAVAVASAKSGAEGTVVENKVDVGYVMAASLLRKGLKVVYAPCAVDAAVLCTKTLEGIMKEVIDLVYADGVTSTDAEGNPVVDMYYNLSDPGAYNIKYLTSGGVASYITASITGSTAQSTYTTIKDFAANRMDCIALIDPEDIDTQRVKELHDAVEASQIDSKYSAMFFPWGSYNVSGVSVMQWKVQGTTPSTDALATGTVTTGGSSSVTVEAFKSTDMSVFNMPPSYAYLTSLAESLRTNAPWLAIAGASRGTVRDIAYEGAGLQPVPNSVADSISNREDGSYAINAITRVNPYGSIIWGNRTLAKCVTNLTADNFLSTRNMICDIVKLCYSTSKGLTFEQNTDVLWINFKNRISGLLDQMQSGYGISGYKILKDTTRPEATEKGTLCAKIHIYPVYAVEDFYITIVLEDDAVTVE